MDADEEFAMTIARLVDEADLKATEGVVVASRRSEANRVPSLVGEEGEAQISLLTPTRILPPVGFNAPRRANLDAPSGTAPDTVALATFERIKRRSRSSAPGSTLSDRANFRMRAAAGKRAGQTSRAAVSHYNLGVTNDNAENWDGAIDSYKRFLLSDGLSAEEQCAGLNALAIAYQQKGDAENALAYHAEHARLSPDGRSRVVALCNAGMVHRERGSLADARACFERAREIAGESGDTAGELLACGHAGLTEVAAVAADVATEQSISEGRAAIETVLRLQQEYDDPRNIALAHHVLGVLCHAQGQGEEAADHFALARGAAADIGDGERSRLEKCSMAVAVAMDRVRAGAIASTAAQAKSHLLRQAHEAAIARTAAQATGIHDEIAAKPPIPATLKKS